MSNEFVKSLEHELVQLEGALRANATFIKFERVKELLATYRDGPQGSTLMAKAVANATGNAVARATTVRLTQPSKRSKIYDAMEQLIRERGPTHRKTLLDEMMALGLMGDVKHPMQSLAIYLSDARDRFKSVGDGIWTLADASAVGREEQKTP